MGCDDYESSGGTGCCDTCLKKCDAEVPFCEIPLVDGRVKENKSRRSSVKQVSAVLQTELKENLLCERDRIMEEIRHLICWESALYVLTPLLRICAKTQNFIRVKGTLICLVYALNIGRDSVILF